MLVVVPSNTLTLKSMRESKKWDILDEKIKAVIFVQLFGTTFMTTLVFSYLIGQKA